MTKKELKEISKNKISSTKIIGPKNELKLNINTNYIISNKEFEEVLAKKAINNGNELLTSTRYLKSDKKGHHIKNILTGKTTTIKTPQLIGCDGPTSAVAKNNNLTKHTRQYMGHQITIKTTKEHDNTILFYPHIGYYAWYVPESENTARIGVCTPLNGGKILFDAFKKRFTGKILSNQSGIIPTFQPRRKTHNKTNTHETILLGDSAGHIKNTTGGGIIPGIKAIHHYLEQQNNYLESRRLRRELYTHFLVHNLVSQNTHQEWDQIIQATQKHKHILETTNRDNLLNIAKNVLFDKTYLKIGLKKLLQGVQLR